MSCKSLIKLAAVFLLLQAGLTSCESLFESEGDCSVKYSLLFNFNMNLKWSNAFPAEVTSVRAYAFDENDVLAWHREERGEALSMPGYKMDLDMPEGKYHIVTWCGVDNDVDAGNESFDIPDAKIGVTTKQEITCRLKRYAHQEHGAVSDKSLYFLYHGSVDIDIVDYHDGIERFYTSYLTKDTNNIRIVLQHISGESLSADDFTFKIQDANGHMAHDNSLLDDEEITYLPFKTQSGSAVVGKDDDGSGSRALVTVSGAIADMHVSRLMASRSSDMKLTITNNKTGVTVCQIPFIDYALLSKDYYEESYHRQMTDQEFLDREDNYVITLFLDKQDHWLDTSILIHSWRVVLHNQDLQ